MITIINIGQIRPKKKSDRIYQQDLGEERKQKKVSLAISTTFSVEEFTDSQSVIGDFEKACRVFSRLKGLVEPTLDSGLIKQKGP